MKKFLSLRALALSLFLPFLIFHASAQEGATWKQLEKARQEGKPKTVIKLAGELKKLETDQENWGQVARAMVAEISAKGQLDAGIEKMLPWIDAEIAAAPADLKPVLFTMRGIWLESQMNRGFAFLPDSPSSDEMEVADPENMDVTTWSRQRVYFEVLRSFAKALDDPEQLQKQQIADFKGLIRPGQLDEVSRPTLYDFVIREVISRMSSLAEIRDGYLPKIEPCLSPRGEFIDAKVPAVEWKTDIKFTDSLGWQVPVGLWQDLLSFHAKREAGSEALLHADLDRIEWMLSAVIDKPEEVLAAYQERLEGVIKEAGDKPVATRARFLLANHHLGSRSGRPVPFRDRTQALDDWKNPVLAREIAAAGAAAHPDSLFGQQCRDLVARIKQPDIEFQLRNQWLPGQKVLSVRTRNVKKLYCRVYPQEWMPIKWLRGNGNRSIDRKGIMALLAGEPSHRWEIDIADQGKHRLLISDSDAPDDIEMGLNILIVSDSENFEKDGHLIAAGGFFRSDLGLYLRGEDREKIHGYVMDAQGGGPVSGQLVEARWREGKIIKNRRRNAKSDDEGYFSLKAPNRSQVSVVDKNGGVTVVSGYLGWNKRSVVTGQRALLFTDRQAYRPGQSIKFKAIVTDRSDEKSERTLVTGQKFIVQLIGANEDVVEEKELTTNEFGSLNGAFDVPMSGLLGRYIIRIPNLAGASAIRVEEYKRPVFEAEIETSGDPGAINDKVQLTVTAKAFSGEGMDGAKVEWRVERRPLWSPRCLVYNNFDNSKQIAEGSGSTGKGGTYPIEFTAAPDPLVETTVDASYYYAVTADVTAPSGESMTQKWSIGLGAADFAASIKLPAGILKADEAIEIALSTQSHGDKPLSREGEMVIKQIEQDFTAMDRFGFFDPLAKADGPKMTAIKTIKFKTDEKGLATEPVKLPAGEYEFEFVGKDPKGREARATARVKVFDLKSETCAIAESFMVQAESQSLKVGDELKLLWASGHSKVRARVEVFKDAELIHAEWTQPGLSQQLIKFPVTESLRGGFVVNVFQMHQGELSERRVNLSVGYPNKDLDIEWRHLSDKLEPGAKDVWTAVIKGANGDPAQAVEMVGTLYDASLDALFGAHSFPIPSSWRDRDRTGWWSSESSGGTDRLSVLHSWGRATTFYQGAHPYASFQQLFPGRVRARATMRRNMAGGGGAEMMSDVAPIAPVPSAAEGLALDESGDAFGDEGGLKAKKAGGDGGDAGDPAAEIPIRTNLQETAFFLPSLVSKADGTVEMSFTIPEAATKWNFKGFAHDKQLRFGSLSGETITTRDFMVRPNPPRFVRVGDEIEFTARLVNQGQSTARGEAVIQLRRSSDDQEITDTFGLNSLKRAFEIPAGESQTVKWRLKVPEMTDWVIYRASATANFEATDDSPAKSLGDGEESWLPVLPRRILVRDAATMTLRKPGEAVLELEPLLNAAPSDEGGPISVGYTVEAVPRPAWLAVKALPYLMEYPHECSEQVFNRYFANSLAKHLVKKNPEIQQVFKAWKAEAQQANGDDALTSPLARNEPLKGVMLEETPFLMEAVGEREERLRIANLFDSDQVERELDQALQKLSDQQLASGAWPWFPGSRAQPNFYITAYVTAGFGRLRKIAVDTVSIRPVTQSLPYLDREMRKRYDRIVKSKSKDGNHLDQSAILYLYARSFFNRDLAIRPGQKASFEFWKNQALEHWNSVESLQSQAQLAVTLKRFGQDQAAKLIMESLRENSLLHDDLGRHWRQLDRGGYQWWQAPIESQTAIIEAFLEVEEDQQAVIDCQTWLLQQKRTQHWNSTKATADAVYAVLIDGKVDLLSQSKSMTLKVGDRPQIGADGKTKAEAGTGRINFQLSKGEIQPSDGKVTVTKENEGPSWVSVYWQSLQDISKIEARDTDHADEDRDAALAIEKMVFVDRQTEDGQKLEPYKGEGSLKVGDTLVTRLILRNDRIYEFVHIKDQRAAGSEPIDAMSGYRWNADLVFYQETRDAATHFFIDRLPAGSHVLEYRVKIQHAGDFATGIGEVECLYAPEFRARSGSLQLKVNPLK